MSDFNARHVVEALRSGVPSRAVGEYFSEARPAMMKKIRARLDAVRQTGRSDGMICTGRYGEGKTHLLNTVFNLAFSSNMAVSYVCLGKETPMDRPWLLYQKLAANTYLPGAGQPGFRTKLEELTPGSSLAVDLLAYAAKDLDTDKLYYLLRAFLGTQEDKERTLFLADLEGDFATGAAIKRSFRRITGKPAKFSQNFSKNKHSSDYFYFLSRFFTLLGYDGWVLLFDEAELIGRLSKRARARSYREMQAFLQPSERMERVFSLFAFSSSFTEDVIDKRGEFENARAVFPDDEASQAAAHAALSAIVAAPELAPLTKDEVLRILLSIQDLHERAYGWQAALSAEALYEATEAGGYLLRTKIRAAIELLDQLYQYGQAGKLRLTQLGGEDLTETPDADAPELPELDG